MEETTYAGFVGYVAGMVIFGYLLTLPIWGLTWFWNKRVRAERRVNPWWPPLGVLVGIFTSFLIASDGLQAVSQMDKAVCLGLGPATITCLGRGLRYRAPGHNDSGL